MSACPPPVVSYYRQGPRFHQPNFWEPVQAYYRDIRIEKYPAHDHVVRHDDLGDDPMITYGTEHHEAKTIGEAGFWYEG